MAPGYFTPTASLAEADFINTLLQRGVGMAAAVENRFNGFLQPVETVETVLGRLESRHTPLKQGVNEKYRSGEHQTESGEVEHDA